MHNEPLDQESLSTPEFDHLDQRLTRALETAPTPQIPADFAARIAASLPARPPASIPVTHYGRSAMLIGIVVILAAMLALAIHTADRSTFRLSLEWTLFVMFLALTIWFSTFRRSVN